MEPSALDDTAYALASEIARSAPAAVAASRGAVRAELVSGIEGTLRAEMALRGRSWLLQISGRAYEPGASEGLQNFRVVGRAGQRPTTVLYPSLTRNKACPTSE